MELKFDSAQEFQLKAIESIANLFKGQTQAESNLLYAHKLGFISFPNNLTINEQELLENLREIQKANGIKESTKLEYIQQKIDTANGLLEVKFPNFSVEMETGTGKTYVYIRTALELSKRYGFKRFIIVVPSIAIKEGVIKTFKITQKHMQELYDNLPYKFYSYDSSSLNQIRQFSTSANLEFMIMTLDSFNKSITEEGKGNVIRRPTDRLQGIVPIHIIQEARPILILDEPQNMESEKSVAALTALKPLFALRYSATHKVPYNLVYRLTAADAYRQGLVKKIEVASVIKTDDFNQAYIRIDRIDTKKNSISASLTVNKLMKGGAVRQTQVTVKPSDNLAEKTNLCEYEPFTVEEINPGSETILFGNGLELQMGESKGADKDSIFEAQIRYTIEEHFRKQQRLRSKGVKVLSLFFIDKVENYASENGIIKNLFDRAFEELKRKFSDWQNFNAEDVQSSYFAFTKTKNKIIYEDSTSGESKKDLDAYDLIMKDKERLLSFDSKVAFVFSHSALREGWDNPNVFQICTLNQTSSQIKKRQEIGRGVRLAVDQTGSRIRDPQVNLLTVIANQSYESYVSQLQQEVIEEYGSYAELPPKPPEARKRITVNLRKEFCLKPEFKELWERIRNKTKYSVAIESQRLVDECSKEINELQIKAPKVIVTKARLDLDSDESFHAIQLSSAKTFIDLAGRYPIPNLAELITHLLENTTPPVRVSKRTIVKIFEKTTNQQSALDNPFEFASAVARVIKEKLMDHLVSGIQYHRTDEWYEMSLFKESFESWEDNVVPADRSLYDKIEWDSNTEKEFVEGLEKIDQVKMYIKLPYWFKVRTPIGEYNPDWAIVWEDRDEHGSPTGKPILYLVRETKSTLELGKLRPDEKRRIICGQRHFEDALRVSFKVVTSPKELP